MVTRTPPVINQPEPDKHFTKVPNDLIRCPHLTGGQKETWLMIASVSWYSKYSERIGAWADVAQANGISYKKFMDAKKSLERAGALVNGDNGWELVVPSSEAPEITIQQEVEDTPKRKHELNQKEAWALAREGWNKAKPDGWVSLPAAMNLPVMIALETQAKKLNIERPNYGAFVAQVCRGAGQDAWWSAQNMKASSVFGFSKVTDKKFENVEKLYKAGAKVEVTLDYGCDADIISRYHDKGRPELSKVIRLEAEDRSAAIEHVSNIPDSEYDESAIYLYFAHGIDCPVYWTGQSRPNTMYLFS